MDDGRRNKRAACKEYKVSACQPVFGKDGADKWPWCIHDIWLVQCMFFNAGLSRSQWRPAVAQINTIVNRQCSFGSPPWAVLCIAANEIGQIIVEVALAI